MNRILYLIICAGAVVSCSSRSIDSYFAKANSLLAQNPDSAVLEIPAGEYKLTKPIVIENASNLTIVGDSTVIAGDVDLRGWKNDPERPGVLVADLSDIEDLGDVAGDKDRIDFYCDGIRQHLSRWPDEGFTNAGKAVGSTDLGDTWIHIHGTKEGIFEYCDDRISNWADEKEAYIHGYWYWDWSEDSNHIGQIDTLKKVITMDEPYHNYGYRDSLRFYGFNLLCELDSPEEYYIDRAAKKIYWMPGKDYRRTSLSVFSDSVAVILRNCSNVTLKNLTIRGLRGKGILIDGGENVRIENCNLTDLAENAITVRGGKGHQILGCHLSELGCGGIWATGGDRKTLEPSGFVISDNVVENFSLFKRTYQPAVYFYGAGIDILHNRFQGSSSSAMRLEGNDMNVEYNQCFDLVNESDDQGGIDSFFDFSYRRINIRYNHWKNITGGMFAGAAAIRFDDLISGHSVIGNVFENCGGGNFGAVQINGGKDINIEGNVFYGCQAAGSANVWDDEGWESNFNRPDHQQRIKAVDCFSDIYLDKYPELKEDPASARGRNWLTDNLVVNFKKFLMSGEDGFICSGNTLIETSDKPLSYYLDPSILSSYGIEAIPFDEIGPR